MKCNQPVRPLSLCRNISWSVLGNTIHSACQWGILVVLAKCGTATMVGQFAFGLAITAPVYMFSNLQLRVVQATDARNEYAFGHYLGLRLLTVAASLLVLGFMSKTGGYSSGEIRVILWIALAKGFESFSDIVFGLWQNHERMNRVAISLLIKGPLSLLAVLWVLWITGSAAAVAAALAFTGIAVLLFYDLPGASRFAGIRPLFDRRVLRCLVAVSLPLGVVMMLISLNTNIPRYFIEHLLGAEQLGYFAALTYIMVAGAVIVDALERSAGPRLAKYYADGYLKKFRLLLLQLVLTGFLLGLAGLGTVFLFGAEILTFLYQPDYAAYTRLFALIMVAAGLRYMASFFGCGLTAARCFRIQPLLHILIILVNIPACAVLIPAKGLEGAALVLIATAAIQFLGGCLINCLLLKRRSQKLEGRTLEG
ncbi:MAG: Polysaccharide biosynthesis protein [Firmicutes bacterium ADurb.Bin456]|nr:MAG: Polysaccharide biosynthesis protein [Firmicutes bacterium ADurb.Bin456]